MDLSSAYSVSGMVRLTRTFTFDRTRPSLEIVDEAEFSGPTDFGSAIVTLSDWREVSPGSFIIHETKKETGKDAALTVTTTLEGASQEVRLENKVEPITGFRLFDGMKPIRLGVNLSKPSTHIVMRTTIVPTSSVTEK
jgi:hypothetical protein